MLHLLRHNDAWDIRRSFSSY